MTLLGEYLWSSPFTFTDPLSDTAERRSMVACTMAAFYHHGLLGWDVRLSTAEWSLLVDLFVRLGPDYDPAAIPCSCPVHTPAPVSQWIDGA